MAIENQDLLLVHDMSDGQSKKITYENLKKGGTSGEFGYWDRTGTTLSPVNTGDEVNLTRPAGQNSQALTVGEDGTTYFRIKSQGQVQLGGSNVETDPNIQLNQDGSAEFASNVLIGGTLPSAPNITLNAYGAVQTVNRFHAQSGAFNKNDIYLGKVTAAGTWDASAIDTGGNLIWGIGEDGSATFAGNIQQDLSGSNPGNLLYSTGGLYTRVATDAEVAFQINAATQNNYRINGDGTTYIGPGLNPTASNANISLNADGSGVFTAGVLSTRDSGNKAAFACRLDTDASNKIELLADGSATFAGIVKAGGDYASGNGIGLATWGEAFVRNDSSSVEGALSVYKGGMATGNVTARIYNDGSAHFAGNVTSDGTIGFNLEADNPANFNEDGEYIGPVLNIRDRLEAARETFQELQIAVSSATDFASLKAAMLVALEDWRNG